MSKKRVGMLTAAGAYLLWGILPVYWHLLAAAGANEILANRIIWSFVFMLLVLGLTGRWSSFKADVAELLQNRRRCGLMLAASVIISMNWLTYIWAVNNQHVLDASVGYYINPLMSVLLGILWFNERLTMAKWVSIALATAGIVFMTWQMGNLPWVAVALATTFAIYGGVKKELGLNPFSSITLETLLLLPVSLGYVAYLAQIGENHLQLAHPDLLLLLMGTGVVTATPLVLFSYGANLLPLNVLGFFQYISPTLTLLLGVFFFQEELTMVKAVALTCIWSGVLVFTMAESRNAMHK